jgi:hypothetical protein
VLNTVANLASNHAKTIYKTTPIGGVVGVGLGLKRALFDGEIVKGAAEMAAGACTFVPGLGTTASLVISSMIIADDIVPGVHGNLLKTGALTIVDTIFSKEKIRTFVANKHIE